MALHLGRLSPEKGLDQLIMAWKSVSKKFPTAQLMLAGPDFGDFRAALELQIRREGLQSSILMPGLIVGVDKQAAFGLADVYVQPSYSEAFSTAVLEALCCGKPCVITTGCNFPEVGNSGAAFPVVEPNAQALSAGILCLLSMSRQMRQDIGREK